MANPTEAVIFQWLNLSSESFEPIFPKSSVNAHAITVKRQKNVHIKNSSLNTEIITLIAIFCK